jgi:hypothetical protein
MTIARDPDGITVQLDFSSDLVAPTSGDAGAMIGFVDFDTDQEAGTGITTTVDEFRSPLPGATGMGMDYELGLTTYALDSTVAVTDALGWVTGRVKPVFRGRQVTIRIPKRLLGGDDGFLNAAAIVGTAGRPSDIIPEDGHLQLSPAAAASAIR